MKECSVPFDLSFLCKVLSPWTGGEETNRLREAARSGRVNWEKVAVLANRSNLAPALLVALRARKLWADAPAELRVFLEEIYEFNKHRNSLLRQELVEVAGLLNSAGIIPLPFKGATAFAGDLFPDLAVRFMWDLDVLVPADKIRSAVHAMEEGGYFIPDTNPTGVEDREAFYRAKHFAPLIKVGGSAHVELHRKILSHQWQPLLDTEAVWGESSLLGSNLLPGVSLAVMSPTHQIIHCFIHSELAHLNHRNRRLDVRQLHHFAYLCLRLRNRVDWGRVAALQKDSHAGRALRAYLYLAEELFGVETPLSSIPDGYAKRYLRGVLLPSQGRRKWPWILKTFFSRLGGCLSEQCLKDCYPPDVDTSVKWRRLHRIGGMLGRYSRWGTWREMIATMNRRYDSLG